MQTRGSQWGWPHAFDISAVAGRHPTCSHGSVIVEVDIINGDGRADFHIKVDHVHALTAGDFILQDAFVSSGGTGAPRLSPCGER